MISLNVNTKTVFNPRLVIRRERDARKRVFSRQGAYVRGVAARLIRRRKTGSSAPGTPPYTRTGALKRAIRFGVETDSVVVGPTFTGVGRVGETHEFGGVERGGNRYRKANYVLAIGGHGPLAIRDGQLIHGKLKTSAQVARARELAAQAEATEFNSNAKRRYPARPFMGPALQKAQNQLPELWRNAIQ